MHGLLQKITELDDTLWEAMEDGLPPLHLAITQLPQGNDDDNNTAVTAVLQDRITQMLQVAPFPVYIARCEGNGNLPIHTAAMQGNLFVVQRLAECDPFMLHERNIRTGATPLHLAQTVEVAKYILAQDVSVACIEDDMGQLPFHRAIQEGRKDVADSILQALPRTTSCASNVIDANNMMGVMVSQT
jgi:ankyrin repeat protein